MAAGAVKLALSPPLFPHKPTSIKSKKRFASSNRRRLRPISSSLLQEEQNLSFTDTEASLIEALLGIQGRGRAASPRQLEEVERAVRALEDLGGVPDPTSTTLIEGCWQLIFTTRPGTASPIQRTFVGVDVFKIFQEVYLKTNDPRVSNIVKFSDAVGELKVEAAATVKDGKRILFQFDRAAFSFRFLPFKVPYPVPFRLLGDDAKGWLDTTYLSRTGSIRISRGNKGTTFVLQKKNEPRQRLLSAISMGTGVIEVINELVSLDHNQVKAETRTLEGEWQLLWTSQSEENWPAVAAIGLKGLQIIKKNGRLENVVDIFPGFQFYASGNLIEVSSNSKYSLAMNNGAFLIGTFRFPLNISSQFDMELLYIDNKIRIARGYKNIISVHLRVGSLEAQ